MAKCRRGETAPKRLVSNPGASEFGTKQLRDLPSLNPGRSPPTLVKLSCHVIVPTGWVGGGVERLWTMGIFPPHCGHLLTKLNESQSQGTMETQHHNHKEYNKHIVYRQTHPSINFSHIPADKSWSWKQYQFSAHIRAMVLKHFTVSQVAQWWRICLPVKETQETVVWSLDQEDLLEKGTACNPLQYFCLEISTNRGAWWATVHGVDKSRNQLSDWAHTLSNIMSIRIAWRIIWIEK